MQIAERIISQTNVVSPQEVLAAFAEAERDLRALLVQRYRGLIGFRAIETWCHEVRRWGADLLAVDAYLSIEGFIPPLDDFDRDPDAFILAWAMYFDTIRLPLFQHCADRELERSMGMAAQPAHLVH